LLIAAELLAVALPVGGVRGDDRGQANQQAAKAWAMQAIAVIQAQTGDDLAAKRTALQIVDGSDVVPSDVTAVWCLDGQVFYGSPPCTCYCPWAAAAAFASYPFGWGGRDSRGNQCFFSRDRAGDHVPAKCPPGLPSDYLGPDPHHGAVVDFCDDQDSHGTRITSRRYADGYVVIETPQRRK
jgi:hypothetical protein